MAINDPIIAFFFLSESIAIFVGDHDGAVEIAAGDVLGAVGLVGDVDAGGYEGVLALLLAQAELEVEVEAPAVEG